MHAQVKRPFESLPGVRFQENVDYDKLFSSLSDNAKDRKKSAALKYQTKRKNNQPKTGGRGGEPAEGGVN